MNGTMNLLNLDEGLRLDHLKNEQLDSMEAYNQIEIKRNDGHRNNHIRLISHEDEFQRHDSGIKINLALQSRINLKNNSSMNSQIRKGNKRGNKSKAKIGVSDFKDEKMN